MCQSWQTRLKQQTPGKVAPACGENNLQIVQKGLIPTFVYFAIGIWDLLDFGRFSFILLASLVDRVFSPSPQLQFSLPEEHSAVLLFSSHPQPWVSKTRAEGQGINYLSLYIYLFSIQYKSYFASAIYCLMKKTKYLWYIWYISLGCTEIDRILLTKIVFYASTKCVPSCVRWVESRGLQNSSYNSSMGSNLLSDTFIRSKGQQGQTGVNPLSNLLATVLSIILYFSSLPPVNQPTT